MSNMCSCCVKTSESLCFDPLHLMITGIIITKAAAPIAAAIKTGVLIFSTIFRNMFNRTTAATDTVVEVLEFVCTIAGATSIVAAGRPAEASAVFNVDGLDNVAAN